MLIVMGAGTTDEHRGSLALKSLAYLILNWTEYGHLLRDDFFDAVDELLVAEVFADFPKRFRSLLCTGEVGFNPRHAKLSLHPLRHVVDRAVTQHDIEVGGMALGDLLVADVVGECSRDVDTALFENGV